MKISAMLLLLFLAACSAPPKLAGFEKPELISRNEVIQANKDCINAKMKPSIQYVPQKTEHGTIMLPIAVNCEPYSR
jgi:uncharacterized lipoprotein YajG